jgi:hypothetical protein
MRNLLQTLLIAACLAGSQVSAQSLIHYWHFNSFNSGFSAATNPDNLVPYRADYSVGDTSRVKVAFTKLPGTSAAYTTYWDQTTGDTANSKQGAVAGNCLRPRNPSDSMQLLFYIPSTGYKDIAFRYTAQRSSASNGAAANLFSYSTDSGATWITTGLSVDSFALTAAWAASPLIQINNPAANNNPRLVFRILFAAPGTTGTSGNNRIDNVSVEGSLIPQQTLLHYWHFNTFNSGFTAATNPGNLVPYRADYSVLDTAVVKVAYRTIPGTSAAYTTYWDGASAGDTTNARLNNAAGNYLRLRNPADSMALHIYIPTTGYYEPVIKYTIQKSSASNGAAVNYFSYSTDSGTTWTNTGLSIDSFATSAAWTTTPVTVAINNPAANNNPRLVFRITFGTTGATGTSGNNRLDNISVDAWTAPVNGGGTPSDVTAPVATFTPANNTTDVASSVQPTISFNEDIRLVNNNAITNGNVSSLVELRLNDSAGAAVSFNATINGRIITITPAAALASNQVYYVGIKGGMIEDTSNNAITDPAGIRFTTIVPQTVFAAGDLVPVAYRMNATGTDDEVAFLTFVNILPGTKINFTDAKYTTNSPAQCTGGLVWTAPASGVAAGTVISIKNDAGIASIGTLTGSTFGLSSGGDQCIVYTGLNTSPVYIAALSSNAWLATNTSCSGSNSMLPAGLPDGISSIQHSTTKGNVTGNTANAYYTGTQTGSIAQLRAAILDTTNWMGTASGTAPQTWPVWNFPGPPAVVSASVVNATTIRIIFNEDLDAASATNPANYTGISGLNTVTRSNNGLLADTITLVFSTPFAGGSTNNLVIDGITDAGNTPMFAPYTFTFTYNTTIAWSSDFISVKEDTGAINITLKLSNPAASSVQLVVKGAPFSTATPADAAVATQTLNFTGSSTTTQTINIPVLNDALDEQDEYLVISLENPTGLTITGSPLFTLFIRDNDKKAPAAQKQVELKYVGSFDPSPLTGSTTEIVVFDSASKRLFMTSAIQDRLDIADFSRPYSIVSYKSIDMAPYGGITSVAVKNGIVAVASPNANEQLNGSVVFFNTDGDSLKRVTVGALPDMVTFSPDGTKVITANEGQPDANYLVDPEGSISVIDISAGIGSLTQANVNTLSFAAFNAQESTLIAQGVRKLKASSTFAQDFEPEYVTVSADSKKAWATLQENNAIAEIDLENGTITNVWPLGTKNMNVAGNGFDASDNSGYVHLANYPVKAYYIPDGIANYSIGGTPYLVTANEGDEKEYGGLNERTTVGAAGTRLDSTLFPHAALLKQNHHLGRLRITNLSGDTDNDGDYDELYMVGTRSFSIWNAATRTKVYDSGDDFERITSTDPSIAAQFNADNESNGFKGRSRAKGPEPEGVTLAQIDGRQFAFVALERVGGVMVYDITDPAAPVYQDYKNSRGLTTYSGDHGPEGITYISPSQSPDGKAYITVANEISGTISVYEVKNNMPRSVQFAQASAIYSESAPAQTINLNFSNPAVANGSITVKAFNGSNLTAADYTTTPAISHDSIVLPVAINSSRVTFMFTPTDDNIDEGNETVTFQVVGASTGITIGANNVFVVTITDNDTTIPARTVNFARATQNVTEDAGAVTVTLNLSAPLNGAGTVVLKANRWSGITNADFSTTPALTASDSLVLNLADGATSASFSINVTDDTDNENDESVTFSLARLAGNITAGATSSYTFTIIDNDTLSSAVNEYLINGRALTMYPNPNHTGKVYFSDAVDAAVYDLQGKLLKSAAKTTQIDVQDLAKGIYMIRIEGVMTRKLVIE